MHGETVKLITESFSTGHVYVTAMYCRSVMCHLQSKKRSCQF